jgi:hypothetical protein
VALVRQVLSEVTTPPRWPMYLRQMKQFIRNARPDFDERRYGSLQDLLRACQKDGLVRLERDRQGGLRAFAGSSKPSNVPHGWASLAGDVAESENGSSASSSDAMDGVTVTEGDSVETNQAAPLEAAPPQPDASPTSPRLDDSDEGDDQLAMFGVLRPTDPEPAKATRATARRTRKPVDASPSERPKRARKAPATRIPSRRTRS